MSDIKTTDELLALAREVAADASDVSRLRALRDQLNAAISGEISRTLMERYDVRRDGANVRVIEVRSGRHGLVVAVVETSYEWIEPVVRWDDAVMAVPSVCRENLRLEPLRGEGSLGESGIPDKLCGSGGSDE